MNPPLGLALYGFLTELTENEKLLPPVREEAVIPVRVSALFDPNEHGLLSAMFVTPVQVGVLIICSMLLLLASGFQ